MGPAALRSAFIFSLTLVAVSADHLPSPDDDQCLEGWQCLFDAQNGLYTAFRQYGHEDKVEFVIYANISSPNDGGFVAIGFNTDKGTTNAMTGASITECVMSPDGAVNLYSAYAPSPTRPTHLTPDNFGVELLNSSFDSSSDRLMCHFSRDTSANYTASPPQYADLRVADCVIMAHGNRNADGTIAYHGRSGKSKLACNVDYYNGGNVSTPTSTPAANPTNTALPTDLPSPGNCMGHFGCMTDEDKGLFVAFKDYNAEYIQIVATAMSGVSSTAGGFVGVGFNVDRGGSGTAGMVNANVFECVMAPNGAVRLFTAFATSKSTPERFTPSDFGAQLLESSYENGRLTCHIIRKKSAHYEPHPNYFYNLANATCVIMAHGPLSGSGSDMQISYHGESRSAFGCNVDYSGNFTDRVTSETPLLIRVHGSLMTGAWLLLISTGMIVARYYKNTWLTECCNSNAWFRLHQTYQTLGLMAMLAGAVCIFVHVKGWVDMNTRLISAHALCGIIALGLAVCQPFIALCRCAPDAKNRWVFNTIHRSVGTAALSLAVASVFLGARLPQAEMSSDNQRHWFILCCTFVGLEALVYFVLEITKCSAAHRDMNQAKRASEVVTPSPGSSVSPLHQSNSAGNRSTGVKWIQIIVLALYTLATSCICVLLLLILNNVIDLNNLKI